ncbi:HAD family hydrolase [Deinococcus cellulosilyticus]|uniref:Uncharacterized protein n=1 Tax=Deinococcus cellulosilyticus (strain DSM 18568 / NBRC 106333 / KACC 11606 / 5516J-15) TaxID=1223518 RepID=A0A511NAJ3_DEIC1|nr:HAD family hydrolase [Deinococcus cellulosilyticus]GEM49381.1 hypothetical protein DC3_50160 [Deinococcus cellulosilyticus NBRC 106333 = KACC 11606]
MFEAIIFDFDGLILDTETPEFEAYEAFYQRQGKILQLSEWQMGVGTWGAFDPWAAFEFTEAERDGFHAQVREDVLRRIGEAPLREGVKELFEEAKAEGIRIAMATSSDWEWIDEWTGKHGIQQYFEIFATRYEVHQVKPAPDLYLLALSKLGLHADQAIAVEDSLNGSTAAITAGLRCVVVPNKVTSTQKFRPECKRLDSLAGGLTALRALFAK